MKSLISYVPASATRTVSRAGLRLSKNAPQLLFVGGVVGAVGATVLACRATLKVEEVLVDHEKTLLDIKTVQHVQYSEKDRQHDKFYLYLQTSTKLLRLYGPSVLLGSVSIAALTKSHNLLSERNAALSAAYAGLEATFGNYRDRVREELGEEKEKEIWRDVKVVETKDGKTVTLSKQVGPQGCSQYAELYSADTNHNFKPGSPEANIQTLRQRENYLNDRLRIRGHVFLNEVLEELGFDHTEAGALVGWLWLPEDPNFNGISFMCWGDRDRNSIDPMMMNNADGIFLDFNHTGEIYKRLDEVKPLWKHKNAGKPTRHRNW